MIYQDEDPYAQWGGYPTYQQGTEAGGGGEAPPEFYKRPDDKPQWAWDAIYGPGAPPTSGGGGPDGGRLTMDHIIRGPLEPDPRAGITGGGGDTGGGGGGWGGGGGGGGYNYGGFPTLNFPGWESAGEFQVPDRQAIGAFKPRTATFDLDPYAASSWADAENEPGYDAARTQLRKQVEAGAAHRGMVRSGMTLGDIYSNLDALSQQNFRQFDDRRFRNWGANQSQRLDKFNTEYGVDRDVYDRYAADIEAGNNYRYTGARDAFGFHATDVDRGNNYRYNAANAQFQDALERWKTMVGSMTLLAQPPG